MYDFFAHILSYVSSLDYAILYAIQAIGPEWQSVALFISHWVGSYALIFIAFFVSLFFVDKWRVALELFIVTGVSFVALTLLKHYFAIDRPYIIDPTLTFYDRESSFALPSGHALMSVVILGWVLIRHPKTTVLVWGIPVFIVLIGLSRIYLGVHYPSQVLAGWLFGLLFLYIFKIIDRRLWTPFKKRLS